jgi:putative aldouronate transport system substrate-binding protein
MPIHLRDGSGLAHWQLGSGVFSITLLKKQDDPEKLKTILRALNYLAAPFGTEEYLYRLYGQEGVDHNIDPAGNPVLTKMGTANAVLPIRYLADAPYTIYMPGRPQDADVQHKYQSQAIPTGVANPTTGLFSNTAASKNATADKTFNDGVNDIIQGRKQFSELKTLVSTWKNAVGDAMRTEYQDQLQGATATPK